MKNKIFKWNFWSGVSLTTASLISSLGLMTINPSSKTSNFTPPDNQVLVSNSVQQGQLSGTNEVKDSTNDLNFAYDPYLQGYLVVEFKEPASLPSDYTLIIPKTYNGTQGVLPVKRIADKAFGTFYTDEKPKEGSEKIKRADLANIEFVGIQSFANCPNLESVSFSENLKWLDQWSFQRCPKLQSFTIPKYKNDSERQNIGPLFWQERPGVEANPEKIIILCNNAEINSQFVHDEPDVRQLQFYILDLNLFNDLKRRLRDQYSRLTDSNFHKIATTGKDHEFLVYESEVTEKKLVGLNTLARDKTELIIPSDINLIDKYSFQDRSEDLEYITFSKGTTISNIDSKAFVGVPDKTKYRINVSDVDSPAATALRNVLSDSASQKLFTYKEEGNFVLQGLSTLPEPNELSGLTEDGKKATALIVPDKVASISENAFADCSTNLGRITFQSENIDFEPNALKGVSSHTVYYVDSNNSECATINNLKQQTGIDATKIYLQKETEQDFIVRSRLDGQGKALVGLSGDGLTKTELTISGEVSYIDSESFKDITKPITKITFAKNSKLDYIGSEAFKNENLRNTQYIADASDSSVVKLLNQKGINGDSIVLDGDQFMITASGILVEVKPAQNQKSADVTRLLIPKTINGVDVTGIGPNAFKNYLKVKQIEFSDGVNLDKQKIDQAAFSNLNHQETVLYSYNDTSAAILSETSQMTVGIANGNFFNKYHDQSKLIGLTLDGRGQKKLEIPASVTELGLYAFLGCSNKLNQIYIDSTNINLTDDVFSVIPQETLKNLQFYVVNDKVETILRERHIDKKNIHSPPKSKISYATIGIIVGSICFAILLLGLGIGIPMRKQNKINVLNARLTHRRIDKLSTANALAFKKVVQSTGNISQQVDKLGGKMNLLNAAVSKVAKMPAKPTANSKSTTNSTKAVSPEKVASPKSSVESSTTKKITRPKPPIKK